MQSWKAIILASGRGERCAPLTDNMNKVLLEVNGKSILEWTLDSLAEVGEIKEIFITVDWKKEDVIRKIGRKYKGKPIKYFDAPHLPKNKIDEEHAEDSAGMDLETYREMRNRIEYPEAIFSTATSDPEFGETDYYIRFNGDVLFDKKSAAVFLSKVRKGYEMIEGLLFSAYRPRAIKLLYNLLKKDKWMFVEINNRYLTNAFYRKDVNHEMTPKEFYNEINELLSLDKTFKGKDFSKKAFLSKEDYEELYSLFGYLHEHQHVDTKEHYNKLKKYDLTR